jgi:hypothetical protein
MSVIFLTSTFIYMRWWEGNPPAKVFFPDGEEFLATDKSIYQAGETMFVHFMFCKYTDAPLKIYKTWKNKITYSEIPEDVAGGRSDECDEVDAPVLVPNINPGNYSLHFKFEYQINVFRTRSLEFSTQEFTIQ